MSKSFLVFLKVLTTVVAVSYAFILIQAIGGIFFTIGLGTVSFPSIYHTALLANLIFVIFLIYLVVQLFRSQEQKKVIQLALLSIGAIALFHFGFAAWANRQNTIKEEGRQNWYKEQEVFIKEHCTVIGQGRNAPVYRCDDGSIR